MSAAGIARYVVRALGFAGVVCACWAAARLILLRRRGAGIDVRRELRLLLRTGYLAALAEIIALRGGSGSVRALRLVPLQTTLEELRAGAWPFAYHEAGNMIWFVPLGMLLGRKRPLWQAAAVGAGVSLALELAQWILRTGVTDVDDVLLNALGALLGAAAVRLYHSLRGRRLEGKR